MGLFDFLFGNSKKKQEEERLAMERQAEQERIRKAEEARKVQEREKQLAENRRKEAERQALIKARQERERLEKLAYELSKDFGSPEYKEDRYSDMIRSASFNPFNLTCDPAMNANLQFGNMVEIFKNEVTSSLSKAQQFGMPLDQMLCGYIFNMIESWYNNAGYVPKAAADVIIEQIYVAVKQTSFANLVDNVDQLKYKMYWDLTHK